MPAVAVSSGPSQSYPARMPTITQPERHTRHAAGPVAALASLTMIWGYNWVVMKVGLAYAAPTDFAALRAVLGAAALFAVLALTGGRLAPVQWRGTLLLGLLQTTGFLGLVALALVDGAVGKSAVLAFTMPFWTLVLAAVFLGERIRGTQWLAILLAALGLFLITAPWRGTLSIDDSLFALAAAVCWAASMIVVKRMRLEGGDLLNVSAWQMLAGGLVLALFTGLMPTSAIIWNGPFVLALAYNAVFATALAWLLWLFALSRLPAGVTGLAMLATPVVSILAAWLQLGEIPEPWEGAGMASIIAALALLSASGWRRMRTAGGA